MTDKVAFSDESKERSIVRRAEYDDSDPHDLVLTIPKRDGGKLTIPLVKNARSNIEREDYQDNTLVRIKPLAEIADNLPVKRGYGAPIHQGKGVALLRPGYLYVFREGSLWRELEINQTSYMSDIDLSVVRAQVDNPESGLKVVRPSEGQWLSDLLVPVFLQGQGVMHDFRMAYSEVQWDWDYIRRLESNEQDRNARTIGVGHAWAVTKVDSLSFATGFPASRVEDVPELRPRDLGIELMIENPSDYVPNFVCPHDDELCSKLGKLLLSNEEFSKQSFQNVWPQNPIKDPVAYAGQLVEKPLDLAIGATAPDLAEAGSKVGTESTQSLDLTCPQGADLLWDLRSQKGVACVALPDPLFKLRHSLSQLHLALHYLDAVDVSIQRNPMAHSAMLIRQAVFDPSPVGGVSALAKYAKVIDREKLDKELDASEKNHAIRVIDRHVKELEDMMKWRRLDPFFDDYRECRDFAICEGYLLIADKLSVLQQVPGVLKAQGVRKSNSIMTSLRRWVLGGTFLIDWAPAHLELTEESNGTLSPYEKLHRLVRERTEFDETLLNRLNMQSLVYLEKQVKEHQEGGDQILSSLADAGKVGGLVSGALGEWSSSILTVCKRLIEEGEIEQIEIQRIMQAASSNFVLTDPRLKGIDVKERSGAIRNGTIVGVTGKGVKRGLTDFDRSEGVLTRKKDYLYADLLNDSDELAASSSHSRIADKVEALIEKTASGTMVFFASAKHPEAQKLGLLKVDFAKRVGEVVDGPAISRGLVAMAAFNVFLEFQSFLKAYESERENAGLAFIKAFGGAGTDLIAASLKLSAVMGDGASQPTGVYRFATRPLFDMKNWALIGSRLKKLQATTLVRTLGLASFVAGAIGTGLSYWEMRISFSKKDFDAATGHAIAMAGGLVFLASPLMASLLAIPGWGWAVFGMAMVVGGGLYAATSTDDAFEQLLKRGPLGIEPDRFLTRHNDRAYYSQLLSLMSPVNVTAEKYADVEPDPALCSPKYLPDADDYVITVEFPLVSRLRLNRGFECRADLPPRSFDLVVQEIAYKSSSTSIVAPGSIAPVSSNLLVGATQLTNVVARQSLPHRSAVRFLVKREFRDSGYRRLLYTETVTTRVRVGLQATLDTELGPLVFPAPVNEDYEPFDVEKHRDPPSREQVSLDPNVQPKSPYWYFTEVTV